MTGGPGRHACQVLCSQPASVTSPYLYMLSAACPCYVPLTYPYLYMSFATCLCFTPLPEGDSYLYCLQLAPVTSPYLPLPVCVVCSLPLLRPPYLPLPVRVVCSLPLLRPPYLYSIHNSPTKCLEVHQQVSKEAWQTISQAGKVQQELVYSAKCSVWPVDGGVLEHREQDGRDVVITG